MATQPLREQIMHVVDELSPEQQARVLDYARRIKGTLPPGTPGEVLLAKMESFQFEPGDLEEMARAIEEGW